MIDRIIFPDEGEAYTYAQEHDIPWSRFGYDGDYYYLKIKNKKPTTRSTSERKSCMAKNLGTYTGKGYLTRTTWNPPQYDTGDKKLPMTTDYREALVYFRYEDAKKSNNYTKAERVVVEVSIENGKIKRLSS